MASKPKPGKLSTVKKSSRTPIKKSVAPKTKATSVKKASPAKKGAPAKKVAAPKKKITTTAVKKKTVKEAPKKATVAKKVVAKKPVTKKPAAKKAVVKKTDIKKAAPKKSVAKTAVKETPQAAKTSSHQQEGKKKVSTTVLKEEVSSQDKSKKKTVKASPSLKASIVKKQTLAVEPPAAHQTQLSLMGISPYELKSGEIYMNEKQKAHFVNILNTWKRALMEEVDRTLSHMQDEATNFPDPNDRASLEEGFSLELRTRDRERKLIKKIDEAIEHIKEDEYGYCEACGVDIGIRRLEARPTATLCIDCKTIAEIKEKQSVG